ncbi:patatin-like protein [Amycolatopsis jiangsuensis]|uniref:Putative acylesterase/phospholipase RssA n=1 Tax=Amycolatopsis jiangsuensis TaxID=1181879 RepID=A0A840J364_9PSEU|nr:patatin-like protein [Amycolatopsis jiangsuensis]MBB4687897.1 putative acylesterase/phospholipase RssA [Amycolatopsis jiangsuensis]
MGESGEPWPQEIRIAMTMVGGASLAVWMGGIATETSALLTASRTKGDRSGYRKVLDLLHATVRLDVLTGTSAGGINAACLGLAEAYRSSPAVLRDTWLSVGSLENLIRDPGEAQPRSLFDGDRVLLGELERSLHDITGAGVVPDEPPDVTVLLTGTMIDGETTRYDDSLGNLVRDTEHRMLYRFDGPLWNNQVHGPLALAARSSASFPGAFELSRTPIGAEAADRMHPDMTGYTDLMRSHWITDGGVLVNKPLGPALEEIFERPSSADVRRLLLYVVPTVDGDAVPVACDPANPPLLGSALAKVVSTVLSQTISTELDELTRHNESVVRARDTRVALASFGVRSGQLVDERVLRAYRDRRVARDAADLVRAAGRRYSLSEKDGGWASGRSARLFDVAADGLRHDLPDTMPGDASPVTEMARYRTMALDDSVATGLQLVNAGFRLFPDVGQAEQLNAARAQLHAARKAAARGVRLPAWVARHEPPAPGTSLPDWIGQLAREWAGLGVSDDVRAAWPKLVAALRSAAPVLRALAAKEDRPEDPADTVTTLLDWFELDDHTPGDEVLQSRLLLLHVATRGLVTETPSVDQRVDLVQVSANTRTLLDLSRARCEDKLTGVQASNFGAFYKSSWRASDWMWGRVDGAGWLMQCLLDPGRLRMLRDVVGREEFREQVRATFTEIGWQPPGPGDNPAAGDLPGLRTQLDEELAFLGLDGELAPVDFGAELPSSLPVTAMVLARTRQAQIACEELPTVAEQAGEDAKEGNGKASEGFRKLIAARPLEKDAETSGENAQRAFQACRVSAERFEDELGSVLLTKTLVKAGAAGLTAAATATRVPKSLQPAAKFAQACGRSAWWVTQGATRLGRPWNLLVAVITVVAGLVLSGEGGAVLQWVGLPVAAGALVFLVVSLLTLRRRWRMLLTVLAVLVVAALLFAAFLPPLAQPLFGWLGSVVEGWRRGQAPLWWLVVVLLLVLPAAWTPLAALGRRIRPGRRR